MDKKRTKSKESMSDKPKPWPYQASNARDRSAEEALAICRYVSEIIEATNDPTILKSAAHALKSANLILRHLVQEGAPIRPE